MNPFGDQLLNVITFLPLAGALVLLLLPKEKNELVAKLATGIAGLGVLVSLPLWFAWENAPQDGHGFRFVFEADWIPSIGARYLVGVDGISMLLILLTTIMGFISILSSWTAIKTRVKGFYVFMLLLQTGMLGVFVSLDLFLFYIFWEVMLVPMYFIIGIWGGKRKLYAAIKFFLYTLLGSVLMLLGILAIYFLHHKMTGVFTFDLRYLHAMGTWTDWFDMQKWVWLAFFLGFAIKVPMFPFHTWLPDAHVEAPTAGSVILAAVLLKMGTYGFLRFSLPMMPDATRHFMPWALTLCVIGIIYGAMVAMVQKDWKKLVAYSSVSHLGFCMIGIFALTADGITGGVLQMLNHGLATGALFLIVGLGLRAAPHPGDRRIRWIVEGNAGVRRPVYDHDAVVHRHAGNSRQRFHWRVYDSHGCVPATGQVLGSIGRYRYRAGRSLYALAIPENHVRRIEQS